MKVLHVVWDLEQGGAQTYVHDLIRQHVVFDNITPEVLVLNQGGVLSEAISRMGVSVVHAEMKHGYDLKGIFKLRDYLRNTHFDLVHSHSHNFAFNILLRGLNAPAVYTEHGGRLLGGRWQNRMLYTFFRNNYRTFIAISEEMARVMAAMCPSIESRIETVYNGVDIDQFDMASTPEKGTLPQDLVSARFKVGIIGRLVEQKGIETFLDTAAEILHMRDDVVFPVIGDGPLRNQLEKQAHELGIAKKVLFLGYRPDARQLLNIFNVFLFTSNYEPFGLVLTEAMAAKVPVVALNLRGAVREIIEDGETGIVVDQKDPALLAKKVGQLLSDPAYGDQLSRKARKSVETHFTMRRNAEQVLEIYRKCISGCH